MKKYPKFDWKQCAAVHRPEIVEFLRLHQHDPLTEQEYVDGIKTFKLPRTSPNGLRGNYRNLKHKFGFFI